MPHDRINVILEAALDCPIDENVSEKVFYKIELYLLHVGCVSLFEHCLYLTTY